MKTPVPVALQGVWPVTAGICPALLWHCEWVF